MLAMIQNSLPEDWPKGSRTQDEGEMSFQPESCGAPM